MVQNKKNSLIIIIKNYIELIEKQTCLFNKHS